MSLLRAVVIALLALSFGAVFTVMRLHWRVYTRLPRGVGLAPLHVSLVSLHVLIAQGTLAWALIESFTSTATASVAVRTLLYGVASMVLLVALAVVAKLQRRRLVVSEPKTTQVNDPPSPPHA